MDNLGKNSWPCSCPVYINDIGILSVLCCAVAACNYARMCRGNALTYLFLPVQVGVRLNKDLIAVGAKALRMNMTDLGPLVLPLSEQLTYAANAALRQAVKLYKPLGAAVPQEWLKPYTPDFRKAFDFFCIHTGGRGIIDGLEKEMHLTRGQVEPSRASLYRFGNTSSTSVW